MTQQSASGWHQDPGALLRRVVPVVAAAIILLGGIWALTSAVRGFRIPPLAVLDDAFSHQLVGGADGCEWRVSVDVRNTTSSQMRIIAVGVDGPGSVIEEPNSVVLQAKARRTFAFTRSVAAELCAGTVDDIVHGPVIIEYRQLNSSAGTVGSEPEQLTFEF